ncbi:MAG: hypothetical protein M3Y45_06765 [Actinomycetota bacterium]|nr:hypothetical protein [Actinomycetota bacterium]
MTGPNPEDRPTEPLPGRGGEAPTEPLGRREAGEPTEIQPPRREPPTEPLSESHSGDGGRGLGVKVLIGSILAALILCGGYVALGGLDYKPSGGTDPCDPRPWGDPQGIEETAERFTLSAIDGAACELGVSREELTRALAGESSRKEFARQHDLSDAQIEDALRSGLLRAVDDAENAGAIQSLVATGLRFTIRTLPMSAMISLIENASDLFSGSTMDDLGGIVGGALDLLDPSAPDDSGSEENGDGSEGGPALPEAGEVPGRVGGALADRLKEELPPEVREQLPDDLGQQVEKGLNDLINP